MSRKNPNPNFENQISPWKNNIFWSGFFLWKAWLWRFDFCHLEVPVSHSAEYNTGHPEKIYDFCRFWLLVGPRLHIILSKTFLNLGVIQILVRISLQINLKKIQKKMKILKTKILENIFKTFLRRDEKIFLIQIFFYYLDYQSHS